MMALITNARFITIAQSLLGYSPPLRPSLCLGCDVYSGDVYPSSGELTKPDLVQMVSRYQSRHIFTNQNTLLLDAP